jgi:hypothetical protein
VAQGAPRAAAEIAIEAKRLAPSSSGFHKRLCARVARKLLCRKLLLSVWFADWCLEFEGCCGVGIGICICICMDPCDIPVDEGEVPAPSISPVARPPSASGEHLGLAQEVPSAGALDTSATPRAGSPQ